MKQWREGTHFLKARLSRNREAISAGPCPWGLDETKLASHSLRCAHEGRAHWTPVVYYE